jgi:hypothetical protein
VVVDFSVQRLLQHFWMIEVELKQFRMFFYWQALPVRCPIQMPGYDALLSVKRVSLIERLKMHQYSSNFVHVPFENAEIETAASYEPGRGAGLVVLATLAQQRAANESEQSSEVSMRLEFVEVDGEDSPSNRF